MGKYTYIVEIDTKQAHKSIAELRQLFQRGLGDIALAPAASAGLGQTAKEQQNAAKVAEQAQQAMTGAAASAARLDTAISKAFSSVDIDPTKADLFEMSDALDKLEEQLRQTRAAAAGLWASVPEQTQEAKNILDDYYDKLARTFSPEQAAIARANGTAFSRGDIYREFPQDVDPPENFTYKVRNDEIVERQRLSAAEKQRANELEIQEYEQRIALARLQGEIAERQAREIHEAISELRAAGATDNDLAQMNDEANRLFAAITEAGQEEARLIREYTETVDQIEKELAEARAKAERTQVKEAGGVAITRTQSGAQSVGETNLTVAVRKSTPDNLARSLQYVQEMERSAEKMAEYFERSAKLNEQEAKAQAELIKATSAARAEEETLRLKAQTEQIEAIDSGKLKLAEERKAARESLKQARVVEDASKRLTTRRVEQQKRLTKQTEEEEKRRTAIAIAEQKRITNAQEAEIRRQTDLRRSQLRQEEAIQREQLRRQNSAPRGLAANFLNPTNVAYGLGAAVGIYSIDTAARQFYDQGKLGAQQERTAETFDFLADRVGSSSERIIESMKEAAAGTINDADAMALAAQVLAQRFANNRETLEEDLAVFTRAARRFTQVYVDESGNFLTTQEVFGRLVKFIREGNKELVDQFGISNQLIAETLGIPNEGLRGSEGAALRFEGVVRILTQELDRLGTSSESNADKLEAAEARITDAMNRLRQQAAPAVTGIATNLADFIDYRNSQVDIRDAEVEVRKAVDNLKTLTQERDQLIQQINANEAQIGGEFMGISPETIARTDEMRSRLKELGGELDAATQRTRDAHEVMARLDPEIRKTAESFGALSDISNPAIRDLEDLGNEAQIVSASFDTLYQGMDSGRRAIVDATLDFLELNTAVAALIPNLQTVAITAANMDLQQEQLRSLGGYTTADVLYPGATGFDPARTYTGDSFDDEIRKLDMAAETERQKRIEQFKTEQEARKAWESAAKSAADDWARQLESALQAVPGLFGTSDVTEQDMTLSEFGAYQEKADEYLRRLRDEVLNDVQYEDVDIQDAARRANIDPNLPAELILTLFEQAWADSSLFADGQNLDLINQDAVQAEIERQQRAESGRNAIRELFGLPTEDAGNEIGVAAGNAFIETATAGTNPEALAAAALGQGEDNPLAQGIGDAGMEAAASALIGSLESAFQTDAIRDRLYNIGYGMPAIINEGYEDGVADQVWGDTLIGAVADQVLEALAAATEEAGATP